MSKILLFIVLVTRLYSQIYIMPYTVNVGIYYWTNIMYVKYNLV